MDLKAQILEYVEKHRNPSSHEFKCGTNVKGISLKKFLMDWYNQGVKEYREYGTMDNINAVKKLVNN